MTQAQVKTSDEVNVVSIDSLVTRIKKYYPNFNEEKFRAAYAFAAAAHAGQVRKSNEPYILHPVETVKILASLRADEDTLIAALLHDVPEDTNRTLAEIEQRFGKKVTYLVDGITKLSKVYYRHDMEERQIESLKKLLLHSAKDARVILIKLADRLHNMRTIGYIDKVSKRERIARETLEIYVPIANLLGIEEVKREIEDLCFETLMPQEYQHIHEELRKSKDWQQKSLDETVELLRDALKKENIEFKMSGREKSLYSIFKKIVRKGTSIQQGVHDFLALRVIVKNRIDCYRILGVIHKLFKPMPGRMKDYIAVPKNNGYQSLHTTVFGIKGARTEFQIRTDLMHLESEYGIAAHYFYESGSHAQDLLMGKRAEWVRKILALQKDQQDNKDFLENLKVDIFQDKIFIFTPKGDVIDLPQGATSVDYAYAIHTDIGNKAIRAEINGKSVSLTTPLKSGDTVHVITSTKQKGPKREWLLSVKTNHAKANIRSWLRKESRENKYKIGRKWLQRELDRVGLGLVEDVPARVVKLFLEKYPYTQFDDVIVAIGEGTLRPEVVLQRLFPDHQFTHVNILSKVFNKYFRNRNTIPESSIGVLIQGKDRVGQLQSIIQAVSSMGVNIVSLNIRSHFFSPKFTAKLFMEIKDLEQLRHVFQNIERVEGVTGVRRFFSRRTFTFSVLSVVTLVFWIAHLSIIYGVSHSPQYAIELSHTVKPRLLLYAGLALLAGMVFFLKRFTRRSFAEFSETHRYWGAVYFVVTIVLATLIIEAVWLSRLPSSVIQVNWLLIFGIVFGIYGLLTMDYINYRRMHVVKEVPEST